MDVDSNVEQRKTATSVRQKLVSELRVQTLENSCTRCYQGFDYAQAWERLKNCCIPEHKEKQGTRTKNKENNFK